MAEGGLVDALLATGKRSDARAVSDASGDAELGRRVGVAVRRHALHVASVSAVALFALGTGPKFVEPHVDAEPFIASGCRRIHRVERLRQVHRAIVQSFHRLDHFRQQVAIGIAELGPERENGDPVAVQLHHPVVLGAEL